MSTLLQPLLSTIPLQVFAASVARARGYDVDKGRGICQVRHRRIVEVVTVRDLAAQDTDAIHVATANVGCGADGDDHLT